MVSSSNSKLHETRIVKSSHHHHEQQEEPRRSGNNDQSKFLLFGLELQYDQNPLTMMINMKSKTRKTKTPSSSLPPPIRIKSPGIFPNIYEGYILLGINDISTRDMTITQVYRILHHIPIGRDVILLTKEEIHEHGIGNGNVSSSRSIKNDNSLDVNDDNTKELNTSNLTERQKQRIVDTGCSGFCLCEGCQHCDACCVVQ